MSNEDHNNSNQLRVLGWLSQYFQEHCREDLAKQIFEDVSVMKRRRRQQNGGSGDENDSQSCDRKKV